MKMRRAAIYRITNTTNGKVYIGSSKDASKRLYKHGWMLRRGRHDNTALQAAWDKDGPDAFKFEIVEYIDDAAAILTREQFWIDAAKSASHWYGYNACPVAGTREGTKQPDTVSATMAAFHKGKPKTPEQRAKMSAAALGRKKSPEHKQRLREAAQRQFADPTARIKAAEYGAMATPHMTGKTHTPEALAKMKAAHAKRPRGPNGHYLKQS